MEVLKTLKRKRYPKVDGDSLFSDVHRCRNVFPSGVYRVELPSGKSKLFRYKSFYSMMLGPAYQVLEEIDTTSDSPTTNKSSNE